MAVQFKNVWGATNQGQGTDQARTDLFVVHINMPAAVTGASGAQLASSPWDQHVQFAVAKFPFPARSREMVPIKYLNQTNFQIGADTATPETTLTVRYAFNRQTATVLERWHWLTSHPATGGVALTSGIKANGYFQWLVPKVRTPVASSTAEDPQAFDFINAYKLEGILLKGLKPSDADMETSNGLVTLELSLQIDRYYPVDPALLSFSITSPNGIS